MLQLVREHTTLPCQGRENGKVIARLRVVPEGSKDLHRKEL